MKTKLLRKVRKNYRIIKEVASHKADVYYIENLRYILFIPAYWRKLSPIVYSPIKTMVNSHSEVMMSLRSVLFTEYGQYTKKHNHSKKIQKIQVWYDQKKIN